GASSRAGRIGKDGWPGRRPRWPTSRRVPPIRQTPPPTRRGPDVGPRGRNGRRPAHLSLAGVLELPPLRLAEPGLLALLAQLPEHRGVQRGVGRLAARRPPVPLRRHRLDHFLAAHRFALLLEHAGGGVEGAHLLWLRRLRLLGGLWGLRLGRALSRLLR